MKVEVEVCHRSSQSRSCLYMFRFSTIADMVVPGAQCLVLLQSKTWVNLSCASAVCLPETYYWKRVELFGHVVSRRAAVTAAA